MPETLKLEDATTHHGSLGQALLFSAEIELAVQKEEETEGRYTAVRFREKRKDAYLAAIELLGRGMGMLAIGRLLGVHHKTVAAVRDAEPERVDIARSKQVGRLRTAADLQIERLIEHPECVPFNVSGLLIAQLLDKAELLDGRATARVEHGPLEEDIYDWQAFVEKMLPADAVRELPASGMGSVAGENSAIEGPRENRAVDLESTVSHLPAEAATPTDTTSATIPTAIEPETERDPTGNQPRGGGGLPAQPGGGQT